MKSIYGGGNSISSPLIAHIGKITAAFPGVDMSARGLAIILSGVTRFVICCVFLVGLLALSGVAPFSRLIAAAPTPKALTGRIVFDHSADDSHPYPTIDIYSVNADGTQLRALTNDGHSHDPCWSADGRHILYIHDTYRPGSAPARNTPNEDKWTSHSAIELYVMDSDGKNAHLLRRFKGPIKGPVAWSPDGKTMAVNYNRYSESAGPSPDGKESCGFFLIPMQGQDEVCPMFSLTAMEPAWRPDGGKLAFILQSPLGLVIAVRDADGSNQVQLTGRDRNVPHSPLHDSMYPAWSPDGKQIAFDASYFVIGPDPEGEGNQQIILSDQHQIFVMRADGSDTRQLTTDPNWGCFHPTWSPDGTVLAFYGSPEPACQNDKGPGFRRSGQEPEPVCFRRLFVMSLTDPHAKPIQITQTDGANPVFAPVPQMFSGNK